MSRIILASKSPRRLELLSMTGLSFEVITSHVDEDKVEESVLRKYRDGAIRADMYQIAEEVACAQASAKASAVLESAGDSDEETIVIGSDTVVVTEEEILGKPCDEDDARRMLTVLSGRTHRVYTGVAIMSKGGKNGATQGLASKADAKSRVFSSFADVKFHGLDDLQKDLIERYIATGSPMDKAGAYGIQDEGALLIDSISGDYYAVVGLPVAQVNRELRKLLG
ncbi:MAG: septum formation protein Maf [Clostridiales bacterium]|nr:septum formation protein Maf [Clostridiales bacterium]